MKEFKAVRVSKNISVITDNFEIATKTQTKRFQENESTVVTP